MRAQIKAQAHGAKKKEDREQIKEIEQLAAFIGSNIAVKQPSFKANGRLRGKQAKCTDPKCEAPTAVGVRYIGSITKCGRSSACESCWIAGVKKFTTKELSVMERNKLLKLAMAGAMPNCW